MAGQFLFEDGGGYPVPVPYLTLEGDNRDPDGKSVFSIDQAMERFKLSRSNLAESWTKAWGKVLPIQGNATPSTTTIALPTDKKQLREFVIRNLVCGHLSDAHYAKFMAICEQRKLDPLCNQLHAEVRGDPETGELAVITHIDGFRALADQTGNYDGQDQPQWCGSDGEWVDVWTLTGTPPTAAKIPVYRKDTKRAFWGIANWEMYAQYIETPKGPVLGDFWKKGGPHMLAKVAEALAFRKAFPERFSGIFIADEMRGGAKPTRRTPRNEDPSGGDGAMFSQSEPLDQRTLLLTLHDWGFTSDKARSELLARCRKDFGRRYGEGQEELFYGAVLGEVTGNPAKYGATPPPVS